MTMSTLTKVVAGEAAAYLRCGLLAPRGKRAIVANITRPTEFGVLFVPGVGANASQFVDIKRALSSVCDWFDAFEYFAFGHPRSLARALSNHIESSASRCGKLLAIGHSLGGLLLRLVLQADTAPPSIAGFVSICAPLQGTLRSRLALNPSLRTLLPDGPLLEELANTMHRLDPLRGSILTIGARFDSFISPHESALLRGHETLCLEDTGHVGALFDTRVHTAIRNLAERVRRSR